MPLFVLNLKMIWHIKSIATVSRKAVKTQNKPLNQHEFYEVQLRFSEEKIRIKIFNCEKSICAWKITKITKYLRVYWQWIPFFLLIRVFIVFNVSHAFVLRAILISLLYNMLTIFIDWHWMIAQILLAKFAAVQLKGQDYHQILIVFVYLEHWWNPFPTLHRIVLQNFI